MAYIPYPTSYIWQNIQTPALKIKLGHIYLFWYSRFQHDRIPLALLFDYEPQYMTYLGINFHYIHPDLRKPLLQSINKRGLISNNDEAIIIDYNLLKEYFKDTSVFLRRYKVAEISTPRYIPLSDFMEKYWRSYGHMGGFDREFLWNASKTEFQKQAHKGIF